MSIYPNPQPDRPYNEGAFHEAVTNQILNDLVIATQPHWMEIAAAFWVRGGITTTITATHGKKP